MIICLCGYFKCGFVHNPYPAPIYCAAYDEWNPNEPSIFNSIYILFIPLLDDKDIILLSDYINRQIKLKKIELEKNCKISGNKIKRKIFIIVCIYLPTIEDRECK